MNLMQAQIFIATTILVAMPRVLHAQAAGETNELVPQQLLGLVHAPEVHAELKLTEPQVRQLESLFAKIDGIWFRARILPAEKQREVIAQLESQVNQWFQSNTSAAQQLRLRQLQYRAQGIRMLLRQDLGRELGFDAGQQSKLTELATATNAATQALQKATMSNKVTDALTTAVSRATEAEQDALKSVMRPEQFQKLAQILGEPFETAKLKRIYPMAPELVPVQHWVNSQPITMKQLRGKVVVLHFYAFQCHNCHANFSHYSKWHEEFSDDDVVVLGIQTPETSREREPEAVEQAALERNLKFPIMVDLESKNWAAWSNTMWPTVYVIDQDGYIRQWWQGELNWQGATGDQTIQNLIKELLDEKTAA